MHQKQKGGVHDIAMNNDTVIKVFREDGSSMYANMLLCGNTPYTIHIINKSDLEQFKKDISKENNKKYVSDIDAILHLSSNTEQIQEKTITVKSSKLKYGKPNTIITYDDT